MSSGVPVRGDRPRIAYLDLLRIISAYLVVVCHTIIYIRLDALAPAARFFTFLLQSFSKIAVPLFLMVSGSVLLQKQDSIRKTLVRVLRIGVVLVLFSFVYVMLHTSGEGFSLTGFLDSIYRQPVIVSYWYLYAYAGLLLMTPLLQKLVKSMSAGDFVYFFAISFFVFGFWPLIVEYTPASEYTPYFALPLFSTHICYMLLGFALSRMPKDRIPAPALLLVLALSLAVNALLMDRAYAASSDYMFMDNIAFLPMLLASCCFFMLARRLPLGGKAEKASSSLGRCAFGVYLISDLFLIVLIPIFYTLREACGQIPAVLLYQLITFAASLSATAILRRVPLLGRLL